MIRHAFLALLSASAALAAESIELTITRDHSFARVHWKTEEKHVIGLAPSPLAGVFSFDEQSHFVHRSTAVIPITPGVSTTESDYDIKRTGGQFFVTREGSELKYDFRYCAVVPPAKNASAKAAKFSDIASSGTIRREAPIILHKPAADILTIRVSYRPF
jgi:hypothetical protein